MHRLLKRQIKKHFKGLENAPPELSNFFRMVQEAYEQYESDNKMLERSLDLSSNELLSLNTNLLSQKEELEKNISMIKDMQKQIIMQEKMASLGGLTAGIAHEIKNPLNFVTNFADLSKELVEELNDSLIGAKDSFDAEDYEDIEETLGLLKGNVIKINEHGLRADSIVRGMLMHSRGKAGERTPTDINQLSEEYSNLAYHGLRAKDTTFNVTFVKEFAPDLPKVSVVAHNFSRVILNIVNNACYAASKRQKSNDEEFAPEVKISTHHIGNDIQIKIRDNGVGISEENIKKIFNPFFTTKPTGEGTGLGLSMSYDIVVQEHRGSLSANSKLEFYTEFVIEIPIKQVESLE